MSSSSSSRVSNLRLMPATYDDILTPKERALENSSSLTVKLSEARESRQSQSRIIQLKSSASPVAMPVHVDSLQSLAFFIGFIASLLSNRGPSRHRTVDQARLPKVIRGGCLLRFAPCPFFFALCRYFSFVV